MSKSSKAVRVLLLSGVSVLLVLMIGSLVKYHLVANAILQWLDQLKPKK